MLPYQNHQQLMNQPYVLDRKVDEFFEKMRIIIKALSILVAEELILQGISTSTAVTLAFTLLILVTEELFLQDTNH